MNRRLWFLFLFTFAACAGSQKAVIEPLAQPKPGEANVAQLIREADELFEQRLSEMSMREALLKYEQAYALDPTNAYVLDRLAIGYYGLAYAYVPTAETRIQLHDRGRQFALKRLELHPGYREVIHNGGSIPDAVAKINEKEYVHALWMAAANWGWWAELQGIQKVAFDVSKVRALMQRAVDLDPSYHCSGPLLMAAAFYAKAGAFGGDMEKARQYYEEATKDPVCYDNKIYFASFWAIPMDDRDLFLRLVTEVDNAPEDLTSEYRLENRVAKQKAKKLLTDIDKLF